MDVAWNQVKVNGLPREEKQRLLSEVEILKELDHKNIIKLYHSWIVTEKDEISVNFITEACAQTLKKYAAKLKTNLDLRAVKSWSRQILRGLDYLHSHEPPIVHRDLKCDNIFVNQNQGEVKIGDLGLAAALENQRTKSVIGTPEFMAPELYDEDYDERVDIYSFGMCIIELVTHECPYSECSNPAQIYKRVTGGVKPEALDKIIDSDLRSFILKCISPIEKRLTAKELMNDPFLDKSLKPKLVEKPARATVEEEPEAERPGGTAKYAVVNGDKKEREEDDGRPGARSARESAAEGEHNPDADAGAAGDARLGGFARDDGSRHGSEKGDAPGPGSAAALAAAAGSTHEGSTHGGSDAGSRAESETTSPTSGGAAAAARVDRGAENASSGPGDGEGLARGDVREKNAGAQIAGIGSEISSPSGSRDELSSEAGDAPSGLPRSKSRLGLSSNSASRDNLAAMAEPAADAAGSEPEPRRKGGSLDFRVKGRILEDKTLRLRLKIGDASGHTRTVEFPFNTDTDSSYSVASEMVDELQLAQSDIRTIMNEIENEVKFLNEGKKKMEEGDAPAPAQAAVSETTSAQKARSSAPELGGYSSGDGASGSVGGPRPMTRSQSHHAVQPSPPRAGSPAPAAAPPAGPAFPATAPPAYPDATAIPPPPPPAVIEAAVEAAAREAAARAAAAASSGGGADSPAGGQHSPPASSAAAPASSHWTLPPGTGGAPGPMAHLEHQMAHAHLHAPHDGKAHPSAHHGHHHGHHRGSHGAPSSTASSVISEDLTYMTSVHVEEEDVEEEREMEQLVALHQREAADMARRHSLQMAEKREAMTRRKLERKSLLGGAHGVGSASSMSSAGDGHASAPSGRSSYDGGLTGSRPIRAHPIGATNPIGFEPAPAPTSHSGATVAGRPPVAKPPSHQSAGPLPPGSTPPTSPAFHKPGALRPPPPPQQQPQPHLAGPQPHGGAPVAGPGGSHPQVHAQHPLSTPPQPPSRAPTPSPQQQAAHPTPVQQLSQTTSAAAMSRSASNGSVGGHQSSGNTSDDGKPSEKAAKQAKAKEKLLMMEASALLNLDGFSKAAGGGKSGKGEGMKKKEPKPPPAAAAANGDASAAGTAPPAQQQAQHQQVQQQQQAHQQQHAVSSSQAPPPAMQAAAGAATLGVQPTDRCVKPTTYAGEAPLGAHAAQGAAPYNGDIPPSTGVAQAEAMRASVQQQAQQVQQHQQAQQAQMQEASDAF